MCKEGEKSIIKEKRWRWMNVFLQQQLAFLLRILLAGICGAMIGYERKERNKEAGIRTHMIVAIGASLIMIISKYGFDDILGEQGIALDPSRIAAQIVTGVGFLGAGMIFMRKNMISGLTTAAGIWATSGIGMAIGSGMYVIGMASALLIVCIQILLHARWMHEPAKAELSFLIEKDKKNIEDLKQQLQKQHIEIEGIHITEEQGCYRIHAAVSLPETEQAQRLLALFQDLDYMKELEV